MEEAVHLKIPVNGQLYRSHFIIVPLHMHKHHTITFFHQTTLCKFRKRISNNKLQGKNRKLNIATSS